jgi:hypothetical protein
MMCDVWETARLFEFSKSPGSLCVDVFRFPSARLSRRKRWFVCWNDDALRLI